MFHTSVVDNATASIIGHSSCVSATEMRDRHQPCQLLNCNGISEHNAVELD